MTQLTSRAIVDHKEINEPRFIAEYQADVVATCT